MSAAIQLRPYQEEAVKQFFLRVDTVPRQLMAMATGCGKSVILAHVAEIWPETALRLGLSPRVLWLTHTEELIWQAAAHAQRATGEEAGIEKALMTIAAPDTLEPPRVVIGSVPTLAKEARRLQFDREAFGLVLADEAHHSVAPGWLSILDYFQPSVTLGCTATIDRADQVSLGKVYQGVCFEYDLPEAIGDGWLAPIVQQHVEVEGLDFSTIAAHSGDFMDNELATIIEREKVIHAIVAPSVKLAGARQTIIFTPSVASARMVAEVLPRYTSSGAGWISGATPKEERKETVAKYLGGDIQWLANCAVVREGFDAPATSCIVMARATKSRALYSQMTGRGLRGGPLCPVPGKKNLLLIDLVGNSSRHKLVGAVDLLGGDYGKEVVDHARQQCFAAEAAGEPSDLMEELEKAASIADDLRAMRRREIVAKAVLKRKTIDPFDLLDIPDRQLAGWWDHKAPTEEQLTKLDEAGIKCEGDFDYALAKRLLDHLDGRRRGNLCTFKQAKSLRKFGFDPGMSFGLAGRVLDTMYRKPLPAGRWAGAEFGRRKQQARMVLLEHGTVEAVIRRGPSGGYLGLECRDERGHTEVVKSREAGRALWRALRGRGVTVTDEANQFA